MRVGGIIHLQQAAVSLDFRFIPSSDAAPVGASSVFFYHLPKCAGMYLHNAVSAAWAFPDAVTPNQFMIGRIDTDEYLHILDQAEQSPWSWISSHLPYGAHRTMRVQPQLVTFLRDPVDRVRSAYCYAGMRNNQPVDLDGFKQFSQAECNRNVMTKTLAGVAPDHPSDAVLVDRAIETLRTEFFVFARQSRLNDMIAHYLFANGCPNLILPATMNRTTQSYRLDDPSHDGAVRDANALDCALYDFVCASERMPAPPVYRQINARTNLVFETTRADGAGIAPLSLMTQQIFSHGIIDANLNVDSGYIEKIAKNFNIQ